MRRRLSARHNIPPEPLAHSQSFIEVLKETEESICLRMSLSDTGTWWPKKHIEINLFARTPYPHLPIVRIPAWLYNLKWGKK